MYQIRADVLKIFQNGPGVAEIECDSLAGIGDRYIGADADGKLKIMPTPGGGSPGAPDGSVQFNDGAGAFAGDAGLIWDNTLKNLAIGSTGSERLNVGGNILANAAGGAALFLQDDTGGTNAELNYDGSLLKLFAGGLRQLEADHAGKIVSIGDLDSAGAHLIVNNTLNRITFGSAVKFLWDNANGRLNVGDSMAATNGDNTVNIVDANAVIYIHRYAPNTTTPRAGIRLMTGIGDTPASTVGTWDIEVKGRGAGTADPAFADVSSLDAIVFNRILTASTSEVRMFISNDRMRLRGAFVQSKGSMTTALPIQSTWGSYFVDNMYLNAGVFIGSLAVNTAGAPFTSNSIEIRGTGVSHIGLRIFSEGAVGTASGAAIDIGTNLFLSAADQRFGMLRFGTNNNQANASTIIAAEISAYSLNAWTAGSNLGSRIEVRTASSSSTTLTTRISFGGASAHVNLVAGTTALAPIKFVSGTNLTTPVDGTMEFDGTNLYFTVGGVRKTVTLV